MDGDRIYLHKWQGLCEQTALSHWCIGGRALGALDAALRDALSAAVGAGFLAGLRALDDLPGFALDGPLGLGLRHARSRVGWAHRFAGATRGLSGDEAFPLPRDA